MLKKYYKYIVIFGLILIILPLLINWTILDNKFPSNADNNAWIGFFGSYIGASIGAVITLSGVIITINFTRKESKEDRRLSIAPYLKYNMLEQTLQQKHDLDIFYCVDNENTKINTTILIKNIGLGPLINIKISDTYFNDECNNRTVIGMPGIIEKNEECLLLVDLRLRLESIPENEVIEDKNEASESIFRFDVPDKYKNVGGQLKFKVSYNDLMNNYYEQNIEISVLISLQTNINSPTKWSYTKPELRMKKIENASIRGE
ncbi:hypothetical protein AWN73_09840 [Clostridium butyricum]|uniref:Uncharacterized protein n=2 Tax=Clostridium butyricum TaxID=1492 RepID=A0A2S7FD45_CLOBU|nr:hypothetical protein [Clostridium butyricum]KHD16016.1 hypothetical protein OA81_07025 [Clostridium butyricum]PPV16561.1 hypothetical protein AWN73_09840 [Clostridium butyricum]